jgi:hypothetical protein
MAHATSTTTKLGLFPECTNRKSHRLAYPRRETVLAATECSGFFGKHSRNDYLPDESGSRSIEASEQELNRSNDTIVKGAGNLSRSEVLNRAFCENWVFFQRTCRPHLSLWHKS